MRTELETYSLIDRYLNGELNADELTAFRKRISEDSGFAAQVAEQKRLNSLILEAELKSVRTQMMQDLPSIPHTSFFGTYGKWFGAGILVLSGLVYYGLNQKTTGPSHSEITTVQKEETAVPAEQKPVLHLQQKPAPHTPTDITVQQSFTISEEGMITQADTAGTQTSLSNIIYAVRHKADTAVTEPAAVQKIDCSKNGLTFTVQAQATCTVEQEGSLVIEDVKGGARPYHFTLNEREFSSLSASHLASGIYTVSVTDGNGCLFEKKVVVNEKACQKQVVKLNVNPAIGEVCRIPFAASKNGSVTIYSRNGSMIYKAANNGEDFVEWNGTNGHGTLAEPGLYIYIIEYTDGVKENGEVNISR